MKAAVLEKWENLEIKQIAKPEIVPGEALIRMIYAGVCGSDITVYSGKHPTATVPVVVGHEILGIIEDIKPLGPSDLKPGDRVAVEPLVSCGVCEACRKGHSHVCKSLKLLGIHINGGYAEYTKAEVKKLVKVSERLPDRIAALAEPFAVGFHVISRSGLKLGDTALIVGAGPIGMVVALCARSAGASRVVVSEVNEKRLALAQQMGFETINPLSQDPMVQINAMTEGNGFDVVFEVSGSKAGILLTTNACKIRGTIVPMSLAGTPVEFELGKVSFKEMQVVGTRVYPFMDFVGGVRLLERLYDTEKLDLLISDELPLDEAQKAIDSMKTGKNLCKILIKCQEEANT